MAANPRQRASTEAGGEQLSVEAARFYAQVYEPARAGCLNELRRAGCGEAEAEDLFMASFERVMRKVDPIARHFAPAQMVNLMKTACKRRLIDERRHQRVITQVDLAEVSSLSDDGTESPEEVAEVREEVAIGREVLLSLPERDRLVFRQRYQMGLSPREIQRNLPGLDPRRYRKIIERANACVLEALEQIDGGARCRQMERVLLHRYVAGLASAQESEVVQAHLEHCRACQQAHARMRGYLHDVASSLAVAAAASAGGLSLASETLARFTDALSHGGNAALEATRAVRERGREALLRLTSALGGSGGDATFGQAVGVSGVKIASVCAAGAAAATCLAAGVVPGLGGVGLLGHGERQQRPPSARRAAPPAIEHGPLDSLPAPAPASPGTSSSEPTRKQAKRGSRSAGSTAASSRPFSASRARVSGRQTGTEFGPESSAARPPSTSTPAPSSPSSGGGGGSSPKRSGSGSGSGGGSSEFGL